MASSCFIDPYWRLFPCSIWDQPIGSLREGNFDLRTLWEGEFARRTRASVVDERCPHCWTPCEAYPTILGNLVSAVRPHG
jgi:hypothetical protein